MNIDEILNRSLQTVGVAELLGVLFATAIFANHFARRSWLISPLVILFAISGVFLAMSQFDLEYSPRVNAIAVLLFLFNLLFFVYLAARWESVPRIFTGKRGWLLFYSVALFLSPVIVMEIVMLVRGHILN